MIAGESLDSNVSSQISDSIKWNMVNNRMKIEYSDTRELYMRWKARTDWTKIMKSNKYWVL